MGDKLVACQMRVREIETAGNTKECFFNTRMQCFFVCKGNW